MVCSCVIVTMISGEKWQIAPLITRLSQIIIHQIFSLARDWSKRVTWPHIPPAKTGECPRVFPNSQNGACCEKYLQDNKHNSLHFAQKICTNICPWTSSVHPENCEPWGTDNVQEQISEHIFAPNGDYCLYIVIILSVSRWSIICSPLTTKWYAGKFFAPD